jgi:CDP-diacylglycerol---glycerol-3-phosphate 3-phosphatidyltransferase
MVSILKTGSVAHMSEVETPKEKKNSWSLEMFLRKLFKGVIDPVARFFLRIGFKPNMITYLGLIITTGASALIITNHIRWAGLALLIGAPLDVVDGSMARLLGHSSSYGAFIDSVTDRYSELVLLGGLLIHFALKANMTACILVFLAAVGSVMVSYTKARAEALGFSAKIGLLTRVERLIVMVLCLIFNIPMVALWIIAILANVTALQRIWFVRKQTLVVKPTE